VAPLLFWFGGSSSSDSGSSHVGYLRGGLDGGDSHGSVGRIGGELRGAAVAVIILLVAAEVVGVVFGLVVSYGAGGICEILVCGQGFSTARASRAAIIIFTSHLLIANANVLTSTSFPPATMATTRMQNTAILKR